MGISTRLSPVITRIRRSIGAERTGGSTPRYAPCSGTKPIRTFSSVPSAIRAISSTSASPSDLPAGSAIFTEYAPLGPPPSRMSSTRGRPAKRGAITRDTESGAGIALAVSLGAAELCRGSSVAVDRVREPASGVALGGAVLSALARGRSTGGALAFGGAPMFGAVPTVGALPAGGALVLGGALLTVGALPAAGALPGRAPPAGGLPVAAVSLSRGEPTAVESRGGSGAEGFSVVGVGAPGAGVPGVAVPAVGVPGVGVPVSLADRAGEFEGAGEVGDTRVIRLFLTIWPVGERRNTTAAAAISATTSHGTRPPERSRLKSRMASSRAASSSSKSRSFEDDGNNNDKRLRPSLDVVQS